MNLSPSKVNSDLARNHVTSSGMQDLPFVWLRPLMALFLGDVNLCVGLAFRRAWLSKGNKIIGNSNTRECGVVSWFSCKQTQWTEGSWRFQDEIPWCAKAWNAILVMTFGWMAASCHALPVAWLTLAVLAAPSYRPDLWWRIRVAQLENMASRWFANGQ